MADIETVIIGGGQAGLSVSYLLGQSGREHTVLEKAAQAGNAWRNDRWDSFTLVTPNWSFLLPGGEYEGDQPHGFMPRDAIVLTFEDYVERHKLPVEFGVQAGSVEPLDRGYLVKTSRGDLRARNVVLASGLYQKPKIPGFAARLPQDILQLVSGQYRNPTRLPPGAVLVAGAGQSGCQIAEELYQSGRLVYLATGKAPRAPRRYRGRDIFEWLKLTGYFNRTPAQLTSAQARFSSNPQVSGKNGGHTLNLHQFARDGVRLLGRLQDAGDGKVYLKADLPENLAFSDMAEANIVQVIDRYIAATGVNAPEEILPVMKDGYSCPVEMELDLESAGITTIIWAMGYAFDFSLVRLPVFDDAGFPLSESGVTRYPGLYFAGLPWLPGQVSGILAGVGEQAEIVVSHIQSNHASPQI
jgi:putative flavoprotein involved in K+ transport